MVNWKDDPRRTNDGGQPPLKTFFPEVYSSFKMERLPLGTYIISIQPDIIFVDIILPGKMG